MIAKKRRQNPIEKQTISFDHTIAMVSMIDYLISETKATEPMASYFLRLARMSLLETQQKVAAKHRRH